MGTGTALQPDQGPWRTTECEAYYFLLDADQDKLQSAVDGALNQVAGTQRFRVTVSAVAMTFQLFRNMRIVPMGDDSPILNYPEAAFFVMVSDTHDSGRIYIWTPFMYCASFLATVSGREVFGFPKEFSTIKIDGRNFSVRAEGIAAPLRDSPATLVPVPMPIVSGGLDAPFVEYPDSQVFKEVDLERLRTERGIESALNPWNLFGGLGSATGRWIDFLIRPSLDFVFDHRRYDPASGTWGARLQKSHSPVNQFSLRKFMPALSFQVSTAFSHPLTAQLGLTCYPTQSGTVRPLIGCKLLLDFGLNPPTLL